ncbi:MAG: hypothetical protein OK455_02170, partial [Thaumarchaeota archaeon]|nr:hypothetical protein [Nitrososphaerota archaeon]
EDEEREDEGRRRHPHRPGKQVGTSRDQINGTPITPKDFGPHPSGSWPGVRIDLFMPYLLMRANPGDVGTRPVVGPFWESPDVMILPGVAPSSAPPVPAQLGQVAKANADNTVYAHIWNFGKAAAREVVVEFYWCNPAIGINPGGVNLIGQTFTQLGARGSGDAHAVVKCPESWIATYVNGGHECLLVRAWDYASDVLGTPEWDASLNRHLGQRNIHVMSAAEAAAANLTLHVGPLFGTPATVKVERVAPATMPWLQLHSGVRGQFPLQAPGTGQPLLSPPQPIGGSPIGGTAGQQHQVKGDDQQVSLTTTDGPPGPGQAHVYRVSGQQGGQTFGGYTVVILGS